MVFMIDGDEREMINFENDNCIPIIFIVESDSEVCLMNVGRLPNHINLMFVIAIVCGCSLFVSLLLFNYYKCV